MGVASRIPALTVREPSGAERSFPIDVANITVGRAVENDLCLPDPRVSRFHTVLERKGLEVAFRNLAQSNSIFLNGTRERSGRMRVGDVLRLGDTYLVLETPSRAEAGEVERDILDPDVARTETIYGGGIERARLALLSEILHVIPRREQPEEFLDRVLKSLFRIVDIRRAFVALRARQGGSLRMVASRNREEGGGPVKVNRKLISQVLDSGEGLLASDAMADPTDKTTRGTGRQTVICAPLFRDSEPIGVLYGDHRRRDRSFTGDDLRFLSLIARILSMLLENVELFRSLEQENVRLRMIIGGKEGMVGKSPALKRILSVAQKAAPTDANILITGETGTGKNLLALNIHRMSPRGGHPMETVSCAAIPENLLEAELFGYGPQSGISGSNPEGRTGLFEATGEGTILLDEIGDMGLALQAKILHVIEERKFRRLGSNEVREARCRVIAATNTQLEEAVREGRFRQDLYFRLNVVPIHIPPLRERPEDVVPLAERFLAQLAPEEKVKMSGAARDLLLAHRWPGNARELRNTLARALALGGKRALEPEILRECMGTIGEEPGAPSPILTLDEVQRRHILHVLRLSGGNKKRAAETLGISRSKLYTWLEALD